MLMENPAGTHYQSIRLQLDGKKPYYCNRDYPTIAIWAGNYFYYYWAYLTQLLRASPTIIKRARGKSSM